MVVTEKDFNVLADMYNNIVKNFLVLHNIKEVVCTDTKEHYFDKIVVNKCVGERYYLEVYSHGLSTAFNSLLFDFTTDYATCLAGMEQDLYMQERKGAHLRYTFTFNENILNQF